MYARACSRSLLTAGGAVVGDKAETAVMLCKAPGVLAGVPFATEVFKQVGCAIEWHVKVSVRVFRCLFVRSVLESGVLFFNPTVFFFAGG